VELIQVMLELVVEVVEQLKLVLLALDQTQVH
jgi:hypothetical protein